VTRKERIGRWKDFFNNGVVLTSLTSNAQRQRVIDLWKRSYLGLGEFVLFGDWQPRIGELSQEGKEN